MSPHPISKDNAAAIAAAAPVGEGAAAGRFAPWIPIRSLSTRHRERILAHLTALTEADRYLRFGYAAGDEQIARYVAGLDFERDEVFGVYNRKLDLIALAHLAYPAADSPVPGAAEFGGSVAAHARGRGYGARLFEHAMLHARNRGLDTLFIHALSENTAMLRIARKAGARVERAGSETDAYLKLPHDTLASKVEQWVGDGAAELDYRLKQQAHLMDTLIDAIGDVRANIGKSNSHAAKD
jgi:RimJ/RimL family protein N-acetyltransferase